MGGLEISLLCPTGAAPHKNISRTGTMGAIIRLIAVDSSSSTGLAGSPDHHRVTRDRHRAAKFIIRVRIGGLEISLLCPGGAVAHKNVNRSGLSSVIIRLVAVNPSSSARFQLSSHHHRVTRNRYRDAEEISCSGIGGFEVCLLAPTAAIAHKHKPRPQTKRCYYFGSR